MGIDLEQGRVGPVTPYKAVLAATACFDRAIQASSAHWPALFV